MQTLAANLTRHWVLVTIAALALCNGCKTVHWSIADMKLKTTPVSQKKKSKPVTPVKLSVIWTPSTLTTAGQPNKSGFAGQVYFYDAEHRPVVVDGDFVVYGFDESNSRQNLQADHKYIFSRDRLAEHQADTPMGTAYSFWIPWQDADQPRTQVSLLPVFKSADGVVVKGDQSINVVPGTTIRQPTASEALESLQAKFEKRQSINASQSGAYVGATSERRPSGGIAGAGPADDSAPRKQMRTTTIEVPTSRSSNPRREGTINGQPFGVITTENAVRDAKVEPDDSPGAFPGFPAGK